MKDYTQEEKEIIVKQLNKVISRIDKREYDYLCIALVRNFNSLYDWKKDSDVVLALDYLKSQRPSPSMNKEFYDNEFYRQGSESPYWWINVSSLTNSKVREELYGEKIRFVNHIIKKLINEEKDKIQD